MKKIVYSTFVAVLLPLAACNQPNPPAAPLQPRLRRLTSQR